jgi:subtilisin-like proprotein convertase family protein
MKKWRLILFIGLVGLLAAIALPNRSQETQQVFAGPLEDGSLVVRVYFDDLATARQIAITFEPLESNYDKGYLLLAVNKEELERLEASGLQFEVDEALTAYYAPENNLAPAVPGIQTIPGFSCYRTVEETFATAASLAANYPTLASWSDVGNSWEKTQGLGGYDMQVLKLTNSAVPGPKPIIFITSAIHAREYTTAELTTRLAEFLVTNYGTDPDATWILDYHEVHFMLQANPDGRKQAETGILWRKNTNQNYCSPTSNSRGADLNRNFPYNWGCCGGSSGSQCSETYRGASAASEPETQAVVNYIQSNFIDNRGSSQNDPAPLDTEGIYLDIHSSGRLLLWPWGHTSTPAPNGTQLQTLGRKLAYFNGHTPEQSIGLYPTDGTTTGFAYGEMGLAAFTYELGTQFFESCTYFENTLLPDNMASLLYALKVVRTPYITPAGPDAINVSLDLGSAAPGVPSGTVVNLSASLNDGRFNNSNGTEPTQNIAAAEYYLDTPPWDGGTAVAMSASDGNFNSTVERVSAAIDTTSLSQGQHILYVRGQDASGNWGAVGAVFLYIDDDAPPPPSTIFFDDFESNLGWSTNPNGTDTATTGQWERANPEETNSSGVKQLGTTVSGNNDLVTGAAAGSSVGSFDIDNGVTSIRSPNISLPASSDIDLSFSYYLAHLDNATSDDFLRVSLVSGSTTLLFEELGSGDNDNAAWDTFSTDITAFAGQTVYLLIQAADAGSGSLIEAAVDDVRITAADSGPTPTPSPTPPPTAIATASPTPPPPTATPTTGPTSTATNTPPPTATATNTPVPPATNTPGPTATATASPTPPPGGTIFFDDFETNQGWTVNPNGTDTATTGLWERANPEETNSSGIKQLGTTVSGVNDLVTGPLAGSSVGSFDIDNGVTSIRSPNISLPSGSDITLSFSYYLAHLNNATSADFLRVTAVGSSSQVLFEELGAANDDDAVWDTASVSLNAFAGQTIYLLIEAADASGGSLVEAGIDDVEITAGAAPSCVTHTSTNVPIALPNGTTAISSQLTVGSSATIDDLDVDIDMDHVWVGDLSMVLTHQNTGTAVTIIDRPGVPASTYGCSGDDILATLNDEAAAPVENQCAGGTPTINGTFSPNSALSAFDGESSSGTWQLTVTDHYTSADAGTLNAWSITVCSP